MSLFKRITAGLTALSLVAVCTGCKSTTVAMTVGDYALPAGVYIYYLNSAYQQALSQLPEDYPDIDTTDVKAVKDCLLEGKDVRTWVQDKAMELCSDFIATEQKFDELGLSLDDETNANIDMMMDYYWASSEENMVANGISEESFRKVMTSSYKSQEVFEYYYGVDGQEGVTEQELKDYYIENNIRAQYISFDLHDSEGNLLKSDGKAKIKKLAQDYQKRVEDAYKDGGAESVMAEMDAVKEDYAAYQESVAAEETTAETETTSAGTEEESVVEESAAAYDAQNILTMEQAEPVQDETSPVQDDTSEEDSVAEEEETAAPAEFPASEDDNEIPLSPLEGEETDENAETSDEEDGLAAISEDGEETGTDDAEIETEAESETIPYPNENIISVVHPEDNENEDGEEETISYTPDETVYNKLLDIQESDYGKVYFVEEDEVYYLVVRYDIEERMTEDDLWGENAPLNTAYSKYSDAFEDKMKEWSSALSITKNESAIKRYDPYEYNF